MQPTPRHHAAEDQFRRLLASAALTPPDDVEYTLASIVFRWEGPQVAVVVDLDDPNDDALAA